MDFYDLPIQIVFNLMVYPKLRTMVGQRYKLAHLNSERGKQLNGKICKVIGYDQHNREGRLHCQLEEDTSKSVRAKVQNLIPLDEATEVTDNFMSSSPPLSDEIIKRCLQRTLEKFNGQRVEDASHHRLELYVKLHEKIENGIAKEENGDYRFPCRAGIDEMDCTSNRERVTKILKPACYGNGICDYLKHMDIGLKGDDQTECAICQEILVYDADKVVVTLPCLHVFHPNCIRQWLGSDLGAQNWNCPSCRKPVPFNFAELCTQSYEDQLQHRMDNFPFSGSCAKCTIMHKMQIIDPDVN